MQASKPVLLAALLAVAGAGALQAVPAEARTVVVYSTAEPPALREEIVPAPRHGYVWVPGYWSWHHRDYVWQRGHWVRERHGYHYVPSHWEREGDRWRYYDGRWDH